MSNSAFRFSSGVTSDAVGGLVSPGLAKTELVNRHVPATTPTTTDSAKTSLATERGASLSLAALGTEVRVVELVLEDDLAAWLRAVGIGEGEKLVVLRRAAFGGPIHVRTASGGEFALNRSLARSILIRPLDE